MCFEIGKQLGLDKVVKIGNLQIKKNIVEKKLYLIVVRL